MLFARPVWPTRPTHHQLSSKDIIWLETLRSLAVMAPPGRLPNFGIHFPARTFNYPQKVWPKGSNMNLIAKAEREWCTVTARGVLRDCTTGITWSAGVTILALLLSKEIGIKLSPTWVGVMEQLKESCKGELDHACRSVFIRPPNLECKKGKELAVLNQNPVSSWHPPLKTCLIPLFTPWGGDRTLAEAANLLLPLQGLHGQFSSEFCTLSSNLHHVTCFRTILPIIGAWEAIWKLLSVYYCVRLSIYIHIYIDM